MLILHAYHKAEKNKHPSHAYRYCCPKNLTVHSPYLGDVTPGDEWLGLFNLTANKTAFTTVSK